MAQRTHKYWKDLMTGNYIAKPEIIEKYGLVPGQTFEAQFSLASLENIIFENVAFAAWTLDSFFSIFKNEQDTEQRKQRAHTREWYRQKFLGYLHGVPVIPGTDEFDTTGMTEEQIAAAKIVSQAATVKLISNNGYGILRIKAAKAVNGVLQPLSEAELAGARHYMLRYVVDAGTQVKITSTVADLLLLNLDIYYDPLVMSPQGVNILTGNATSVQDAINAFLQSVEFNGSLILSDLENSLKEVPGVKIGKVNSAASKYGGYTYDTADIANVGPINEIRVADSGYMKLDVLNINFKLIPE